MKVTDRGSIVIGWLSKLAIAFALFGVLAYDGFMVVTASFGAADDATTAANEAADTYHATRGDVQASYNAAVRSIAGKGDVIETTTFTVAPDGKVTLTVERKPKTLWMHYVGPIKSWTHIKQTATGSPGD